MFFKEQNEHSLENKCTKSSLGNKKFSKIMFSSCSLNTKKNRKSTTLSYLIENCSLRVTYWFMIILNNAKKRYGVKIIIVSIQFERDENVSIMETCNVNSY